MEYALLRSLRALAPGLIILGYFDIALKFSFNQEFLFWSQDAAKLLLCGYIVGGLYGVIVGERASRSAFRGVDSEITKRLIALAPELSGRRWRDVSPHFYALIDSDKSLDMKSKGIFFNGLVVTTTHCGLWISLFAMLVGGGLAIYDKGSMVLHVSLVASMLCYFLWRRSIARHLELINSQINVIEKRFLIEFVERVTMGASWGTK